MKFVVSDGNDPPGRGMDLLIPSIRQLSHKHSQLSATKRRDNSAMTSFHCQFEVMTRYNNTSSYKIHQCIYKGKRVRQAEANVLDRARGGKRARTRENSSRQRRRLSAEGGYVAPLEEIAARAGMTEARSRQFQEQEALLALIASRWNPVPAIEARRQLQGTVAHFRRDGRQRGTGSSKSGCRRDCISTIRR